MQLAAAPGDCLHLQAEAAIKAAFELVVVEVAAGGIAHGLGHLHAGEPSNIRAGAAAIEKAHLAGLLVYHVEGVGGDLVHLGAQDPGAQQLGECAAGDVVGAPFHEVRTGAAPVVHDPARPVVEFLPQDLVALVQVFPAVGLGHIVGPPFIAHDQHPHGDAVGLQFLADPRQALGGNLRQVLALVDRK